MANPNRRKNKRELKFVDKLIASASYLTSDLVPVTYTEITHQPVAITQGPGASQRIGRDVEVKTIEIRGSLSFQPKVATSFQPALVRFIVVQDLRPDGNTRPTLAQIFVPNAVPYNSYPNLFYRDRFNIMLDRKLTLTSHANDSTANADPLTAITQLHAHVNIPATRSLVQYSADTGTTAINVQYYYILFSTVAGVELNFSTRTRFIG